MKKRVSAILLALCLALTLLPTAAFAEGESFTPTYPDKITAESFGDSNPVYWSAGSNTGYAATLTAALTAAYKANSTGSNDITIWCKEDADVGTMTHAHVADSITIYGNNAYISGGECDLEVDTYKYSRETGVQAADGVSLDKNITINAVNLKNLGVWGQRNTEYTVTINLVNCDGTAGSAQRVYLSGAHGTNNITLTDCDFTSGTPCTVYSNAAGTISVKNCTFNGVQEPINIKHKGSGDTTVTVENCDFTSCGSTGDDAKYAAPIRLVEESSGSLTASVEDCSFSGTVGNNGDILVGDGRTGETFKAVGLTVIDTAAEVQVQQPGYYTGSGTDTDANKVIKTETPSTGTFVIDTDKDIFNVAEVNGTGYDTLAAAIAAAGNGDTVKLLRDVELSTTIFLEKSLTLELNGHTISAADSWARGDADTKYGGKTDAMFVVVSGATLTINDNSANKDGTITAATAGKDACYAAIKLTATNESVNTGTESLVVNSGNIVGNYYGVCGNGGRSDSQIIINDGTIKGTVVDDSTSIYHAQGGKLIINGGVLEGATGLYVKSGTVTISGGTIIGNGNKEAFKHSDNGFGNTGDALVVEACGYTYGNPVVSVIGGTFISENAEAVAYYKYNENKLENKKFISGGSFSTDPSAYAADGFAGYQNPDGTYGIVKATEDEITRSATVNIVVKPADASIVLAKDGDVIGTVAGEYKLPGGLYTLTVTKRGYYPERKFIFVEGENQTVYVALERISTGSGTASAATYSIKTAAAANGDVTASAKSAAKGTVVTITVAADKGYTLETLTVTDQKGNEIALTDKGNGVYTFTMPASNVTVAATFMEDNTILNFYVDVPASAYYYNEVLWAVQNGITSDINGEFFGPNKDCTRAELAAFIYRYVQSRGGGFTGLWMFQLPFSDVPEWCYEQAAWCYMNEIVKGYDNGLFGSDDPITREQVATILYRLVRAMGKDTTQGGMAIREFKDYESISDFAMEAMEWAVNTGVLQGYDGNLMPKEHCSHAQIVLMLYRLLSE